ncbi:MAG: 2,3-epoxybenzoyl-CoA dihydrolase [Xanthobacteraceae bacterium]
MGEAIPKAAQTPQSGSTADPGDVSGLGNAPRAGNGAAIDFRTEPARYRHWKLATDGAIATLTMDVDEKAGLLGGYELKLNSYDLGVDIELADAIERLRFEHPEVKVIILKSGKDRVFCAGANIRMLAGATHAHKVNFCKFTNETRSAIEDASENSGQKYLCVVNGTAAGGGYELALACDHIMLVDDGSAAVSLPELPLLAVLPGTGGLTRITDKRKVRRDHADVFCTTEEGVKGKRAVDWRLVDEVMPRSRLDESVAARAKAIAAKQNGKAEKGIALTPVERTRTANGNEYKFVSVEFERGNRIAAITLRGPESAPPSSADEMVAQGAAFWPLQLARELDDAILDIRLNELEVATIVFKSDGDAQRVLTYDAFLDTNAAHWLGREIRLKWKRVLKRVDMTSRSLVTLIEPGSCFAGTLAEFAFAADRSYMLIGTMQGDNRTPAAVVLGETNFSGVYQMSNGLSRLATRFLGEPDSLDTAKAEIGKALDAERAEELGLVTFALDDIDWEDEVRLFLEERASFSPDGLTGMEANLRFAGPETMETKIFARLTAWQNWIFQRPNAVGPEGALTRYGSGQKPSFDLKRV